MTGDQVHELRSVTEDYESVEKKEKHIGEDSNSNLEIKDIV